MRKLITCLMLASCASAAPHRWEPARAMRELLGPLFPIQILGPIAGDVHHSSGGPCTPATFVDSQESNSNGSSTTGTINTAAVTSPFIIVVVSSYNSPSGTVTDGLVGNSYTNVSGARTLAWASGDGTANLTMWYVNNSGSFTPLTNSLHTWNINFPFATAWVLVFAGVNTASDPLDQQHGAGSSGSVTSQQPGSITPSGVPAVIISAASASTNGLTWGASGITLADSYIGAGGVGLAAAYGYATQCSAVAINPTFTVNTAAQIAAGSVSIR